MRRRRVIIAGEGRFLYFLARAFRASRVEVAVISPRESDVAALSRTVGALAIHGDPAEPRFLQEAGAGKSTDIVASTDRDEDNLVICQVAKRLFGIGRAVATVHDPEYVEVFRELGIDAVVSTTDLLARVIKERTALEDLEALVPMAEGNVVVSDVSISDDDAAVGKTLADLPLPADCLVGVVQRGDQALIPGGDFALESGDTLVILAAPDSEEEAVRVLKEGGPSPAAET